jgi:hypothetical protein
LYSRILHLTEAEILMNGSLFNALVDSMLYPHFYDEKSNS